MKYNPRLPKDEERGTARRDNKQNQQRKSKKEQDQS